MNPDANGHKQVYQVARSLIGADGIAKLREAGIALICKDDLHALYEEIVAHPKAPKPPGSN